MDWQQVTLERDLNEAFRLGVCVGAGIATLVLVGWRTFSKWMDGKEK